VEAPSGERLRGKGWHGVLCRLKLCDPCLSALRWFVYHAGRNTSALLFYLLILYWKTSKSYVSIGSATCGESIQMPYYFPACIFLFQILTHNETGIDETCQTFIMNDEDHTLGNALKYFVIRKWVCLTRSLTVYIADFTSI